MKKINLIAISVIGAFSANAQLGSFVSGGSQNGFTFSQVRSIGLGNFDATTPTAARFHLRNSLLDQPTGTFNGLLIRTDGFANVDNSWKMFTESSGTFSEIFKLEAGATTNNFLLQASQSNGKILFNTGGNNPRAVITSTGLFGVNSFSPANRLQITTATGDPYFGSANGSSGLRFTNMTNANTPITNTTTKVLSIDANGDVILVTDQTTPISAVQNVQNGLSLLNPTTAEFGGPLGSATAAQLLNHREIPMNSKNILFSGNGHNYLDAITLGAGLSSSGKLSVLTTEYNGLINGTPISIATSFQNQFSTGPSLVSLFTNTQANTAANYALECNVANGQANIGMQVSVGGAPGGSSGGIFELYDPTNSSLGGMSALSGRSRGSKGDNYGVGGTADSPVGRNFGGAFSAGSTNNTQYNWGLQSQTNAMGIFNVAGYFQCPNLAGGVPANAPGFNAAVHALAPTQASYGPNWINSFAGYFDGDVTVNGVGVITSGMWMPSDRSLKKDISELRSAGEILSKINPKTYHYTKAEVPALNLDETNLQYGVIAQELEEIMPELVKEISILTSYSEDGKTKPETKKLKSVNYIGFIPILISSAKEQQKTIAELSQKVAELQRMLETLVLPDAASRNSANTAASSISLSDKNMVVLNQNVPNPFAENTIISYSIPEQFKTASIIFSSSEGKLIKTFEIKDSGEGQLNVFANDLTNGAYSYSLLIDGKVIDTKRMIKTN